METKDLHHLQQKLRTKFGTEIKINLDSQPPTTNLRIDTSLCDNPQEAQREVEKYIDSVENVFSVPGAKHVLLVRLD